MAEGRSRAADAGARGEKSISSCPPPNGSSDQAFLEWADEGRLFSCISSSSFRLVPRLACEPMPPLARRLADPLMLGMRCNLYDAKKEYVVNRNSTAKVLKETCVSTPNFFEMQVNQAGTELFRLES